MYISLYFLLTMEPENALEDKETLDELRVHRQGWTRYLAITTALVAVAAAIATLLSGNYVNEAVLAKNEAVLSQTKASDQYSYYEAKGIKKNLDDIAFQQTQLPQYQSESSRYKSEQIAIKKVADSYVKEASDHNKASDHLLEKHHRAAIAVTLLQISIALSAMSALLDRKSFWLMSLILACVGVLYLVLGIIK